MLFTVLCPNSLMLPFVSLEERNINAAGKKKIYILELFITYRLPVLILISTLIVYLFFLSCREEARSAQGVGKASRCVNSRLWGHWAGVPTPPLSIRAL